MGSRNRMIILVSFSFMLVCLAGVSMLTPRINQLRSEHQLTVTDDVMKNLPAKYAPFYISNNPNNPDFRMTDVTLPRGVSR